MTDLRKAAEMALDALEDSMYPQKKQFDAIIELRQALAQPEQEPVCTKIEGNQFETFKVRYEDAIKLKDLPVGTKLYTAPPSKPWVSLTDSEIAKAANICSGDPMKEFARAIEAALRSKNT